MVTGLCIRYGADLDRTKAVAPCSPPGAVHQRAPVQSFILEEIPDLTILEGVCSLPTTKLIEGSVVTIALYALDSSDEYTKVSGD